MAEVTRRRTGEFLRELFKILMAAPDGMRASEALQVLASRFTLSPYEADNYSYCVTSEALRLRAGSRDIWAVF